MGTYRISHVGEKEISWDVLGYYLPLPATFIYDTPLLYEYDWLKKVNDEKKLSGTLYMISKNEEGEPMYFFLFGMAAFYTPFFLSAHLFAEPLGYPPDGFSEPYQYALVIGSIIYTLIGLFFFRKILLLYFSEKVAAIVMVLTVFSTNYIHHMTLKNLETVNVLFMLCCIIIWFTHRWHKQQKFKYLLIIACSITMMALVKPSEITIVLIPLLWGISSIKSLKLKWQLLRKHKWQLLIVILACFALAFPQLLYWKLRTGHWIYDSYKNPGVGLDLLSPHIWESLFSFRKGWFIYTPIMVFFLIGFIPLYKKQKNIFYAFISYFLISFYIISSWSEWWYGAGFSNRPIITTYPVLAIAFGFLLTKIIASPKVYRISFLFIIGFLTFLNQFQWWQFKNYILHPYRTTYEYYCAVFLKTQLNNNDQKLLLVNRDFSGEMRFKNPEDYQKIKSIPLIMGENEFYTVSEEEYLFNHQIPYKTVSSKDHFWVRASFDIKFPESYNGPWPCFVITMDRENGNYGYSAPEIKPVHSTKEEWQHFEFDYLTPEIRENSDVLLSYLWNRSRQNFTICNFKLEFFERK